MIQHMPSVKGRSSANPFGIQTSSENYLGTDYLSPERLSSIGHQFRLAVLTGGHSFLNIGSAHGILEQLLRNARYHVTGIDLDYEVHPNIVGILPQLPLKGALADVAMAFQVLEHMPIEMLEECLVELGRIARKAVLISLPDQSPYWQPTSPSSRIEALAAKLHHWAWARQTWRFQTLRMVDPEHFWEINCQTITSETIVNAASNAGLSVRTMFRNPYFSYHHFFYFDKTRAS